jgi:guanylate kinase
MSQSNISSEANIASTVRAWYGSLEQRRPLLVVLSGPSGVGKDVTIACMKEHGYPCHFVVTTTTRPRRPTETDGVDYNFVSEAVFQEMIARGELLEHAIVYGQYKGIPKASVQRALESGLDAIIRVDVQGAARLREVAPQAVTIFLTAESEEAFDRQ